MLVLWNGQLLPRTEVQVDLEDRAYQFGDGVYEVIRVYGGQLFLLNPHLDRLVRSARAIRLDLPWSPSQLANQLRELVAANRLADPSRLQVGQQLIIPGAQAQAAALRREALVSSSGQLLRNFDWPLTGRISSRFGPRWGRMHQGLDIAVPTGTPVRAAAAGTVTYAGAMGGYGNIVIIDHGNRVETRYAHNSRIVVRVGQRVKRGEVIAYSGNTGNSTGPHLHFEIRYRGTPVNPEHYLKR
ncbi:MAG: peptidoglycan DD-metalloendopeptidase family protein [Limnochordales bacterium]